MELILLGTLLAFVITYAAIPVIINVSTIKKLFDVPNARKVHVIPVPSLGGLGIFAGFIIACLIAIPLDSAPAFQYFFAAALITFFLGLKDDILVLTPMKKLIGQVVTAFVIIYKGGIAIKSMHGFLGVYDLPEAISLALTYLTVIVIINSFNLIDGVDGLAAGLGIFTTLCFGTYFYINQQPQFATLAFTMTGSLLAFLIFNRSPAKIFMGDTGSLLVGLINAILVIHFIDVAGNPGMVMQFKAAPAIGVAVLIIPLFDTLRVFSIRILSRRSPFSPDRNHIHHILLDRGMNHKTVSLTLILANIFFVVLAYTLADININLLIGILFSCALGAFAIAYYYRKPMFVVAGNNGDIIQIESHSRILPLSKAKKAAEQN
ncbi:MAG: undecaprenyl/decaprenyl-phosphate alpha-N-acetylglucosaminyl 1-phosphate transferase [Chitinophagaceae bacterium]|nr:undecaprenyl/decaprenyl-phosphate alpha-N-acetylglucosaminyl 1-phosphate transferase [Chitinophagaceae bacterium]